MGILERIKLTKADLWTKHQESIKREKGRLELEAVIASLGMGDNSASSDDSNTPKQKKAKSKQLTDKVLEQEM